MPAAVATEVAAEEQAALVAERAAEGAVKSGGSSRGGAHCCHART